MELVVAVLLSLYVLRRWARSASSPRRTQRAHRPDSWAVGKVGQTRLVAELRQNLGPHGWKFLESVMFEHVPAGDHLNLDEPWVPTTSDIDIIGVGPAGILHIDAKTYSGAWGLTDVDQKVAWMNAQRVYIEMRLTDIRYFVKAPITSIYVHMGAAQTYNAIGPYAVLNSPAQLAAVTSWPAVMTPEEVDVLFGVLEDRMRPAVGHAAMAG